MKQQATGHQQCRQYSSQTRFSLWSGKLLDQCLPAMQAAFATINWQNACTCAILLLASNVQENQAGQARQQGGALLWAAAVDEAAAIELCVGHSRDVRVAPAQRGGQQQHWVNGRAGIRTKAHSGSTMAVICAIIVVACRMMRPNANSGPYCCIPVLPAQQEGRHTQRRQPHKQRAQQAIQLLALTWQWARRAAGPCRGSCDVRRGGHHRRQLQRVTSSDEKPAGGKE